MDSTVSMDAVYSSPMKSVKRLEHELTALLPLCLTLRMGNKGHGRPSQTEVQAIAARLREARAAMGIDQAELCRRTGIRPNTYNQWEQAKGAPSRLQARMLKRTIGWTLDYIYENDPTGMPHGIAVKLGKETA